GKVTITGIGPYYARSVTKTFEITKPSINDLDIKLDKEVYDYDGTEKEPKVSIEGLVENLDYIVSYSNNIDPGTAKVTITGIGRYGGTVERTFKIEGEIPSDVVDIATLDSKIKMEKEFEYTGNDIEPKVSIEGLEEGTDYIVSYENNVQIGEAKVIIKGKGKYRGSIEKTFNITKRNISNVNITVSNKVAYTGTARYPGAKVEGLKITKDYTVSYENNVNVGDAKITITGKGNYTGKVTKTFIIYRNMPTFDIELEYEKCYYDGTEKKPKVNIEGLTEGKDYSVTYSNNVNVGEGKVTITGIGPYYARSVTKTFTITKQDIDKADLNLQVQNLDSANKQELNIEDLKEGQDYTVAYNLNQDSNSITIKGIGNYKGQKILKVTKDTEMVVEEDGVQYNLLNDGTAEVYNFTKLGKKANIKSKIKDYKVTKINKNAFKDCDKLELVKIPKNVSKIDKDAFKDCKNVTISGKIDSYANTYADENKIDFKESK
uniref:leucine-rich repeat protein n=1 Tax=Intestinibacter bartlettii TaxID=261299 RepID=UPI0022E1A251